MSEQAPLRGAVDPDRAVLSVEGSDAETFLQGLLSNDVAKASRDRAVYAALLTPQGKFLFDMMASRPAPQRFLLEVDRASREALMKRLTLYKLRSKVTLSAEDALSVALFWREEPVEVGDPPSTISDNPANAATYADPRHAALGFRVLTDAPESALESALPGDLEALERRRIALKTPKAGFELLSEDTFPLEAGFERAHGVDFRKGCYVGQEVTARMRHKATLKKGLTRLRVDGPPLSTGAEVLAGERVIGRIGSQAGGEALAILRLDRLEDGPLTAGGARLVLID